jgi:hypothetical protein
MTRSQQVREAEDLSVADSLSFACKAQRFDGDIQSQLVSIFETVNQCSRDTIDANGSVIDPVHFDSLIERPDIETVDLHRRCTQTRPRILASRNSKLHDSWYLGRDSVERQCRNQTHDRSGGLGSHNYKVRIAELVSGREPI